MKTLTEATTGVETWLASLEAHEVRRLDLNLSRLGADQIRSVFKVLTDARGGAAASRESIDELEQGFETWWDQSLAQKLAILECIADLGTVTSDVSRQVLLPGGHLLQDGAPWLAHHSHTSEITPKRPQRHAVAR